MNINSSGLSALFSASDGVNNTPIPSLEIEGMTPENFADALKNQIKQLTNMKEIAGQLSEEGMASEFFAFFGNGLPLTHATEKSFDIDNTIEALENVLNSLENVVTDEINLENRLQGLIEKTEALKTETLGSVELEEKVARLAEELQKIQNIQQVASQYNEQENDSLSFTEETEILENQINQISRSLKLDKQSNPLDLIENTIQAQTVELTAKQVDKVNTEDLRAEIRQEQFIIAGNTQPETIISTQKQAIEPEQVISYAIRQINPETKKEDLVLRQIVEQQVSESTEQTESDSLLQQDNAFRKPGQDNPVIVSKQNDVVQLSQDIDLLPSNEKTLPRFAADLAMLNKSIINENTETLPAMAKHFAHPEWNKEMGERVLWMYKQAIPAAELKLNPRHLGPISIRVDVNQDQATVAFTAQHAAVKEAIEAAIPKLREMFSAQQLTLTDVNVSQDDTGQKQSKAFSQMENQSGNERSKNSGSFAHNEQDPDLLDIAEEIEAGRAISSNGILSVFA